MYEHLTLARCSVSCAQQETLGEGESWLKASGSLTVPIDAGILMMSVKSTNDIRGKTCFSFDSEKKQLQKLKE